MVAASGGPRVPGAARSIGVLTLSVDVRASTELTWAAATDWAHQGEWMYATTVSSTGVGVGSELQAYSGFPRLHLGFLDTMLITQWDPPRICRVAHTGRVVKGTGYFEVHSRGPHLSTFVWSESLELPLGRIGRWAWPALRPVFAVGVSRSLKRFARWVPGRSDSLA